MGNNGNPDNPSGDGGQTQPPNPPKIILVGMMGAGKTTLGRLLAARLACPFLDIDTVIETEAGQSIPDIFRLEGEAAFRRRELAAVRRLLDQPGAAVLAAGGGAFCQEDVRRCAQGRAASVFLRVGEEDLLRRLAASDIAARPMIAGDAWRERVRDLLRLRYPLYEQADLILDIPGDEAPGVTADRLITHFRSVSC